MNRNQATKNAAGVKPERPIRRRIDALGLKGRLMALVLAIIGAFVIFNVAVLHEFGGVVADTMDRVQIRDQSGGDPAAMAVGGGLAART
jgi:hypothetical protein